MESDEIEYLKRRLQILRVQRAIFGPSTPPHIIIDIEDTERKLGYTSSASHQSDADNYRALAQSIADNHIMSSVELLTAALLIATKVNDPSLGLFCYYELVGWDFVDRKDIPPYRTVQGFFEVPMNWKKPQRTILSALSSNGCKVMVRESLVRLEKRIEQATERQLLALRDIDRMSSGDMERIPQAVIDVVDRQFSPDDEVRVYANIYNYKSIVDLAKQELTRRLMGLITSQIGR